MSDIEAEHVITHVGPGSDESVGADEVVWGAVIPPRTIGKGPGEHDEHPSEWRNFIEQVLKWVEHYWRPAA